MQSLQPRFARLLSDGNQSSVQGIFKKHDRQGLENQMIEFFDALLCEVGRVASWIFQLWWIEHCSFFHHCTNDGRSQ